MALPMLADETSAGAEQDYPRVLARLRAEYLSRLPASEAASVLRTMKGTGEWSDINYADRSLAAWAPIRHVERLRSIAVAHSSAASPLYKSEVARAQLEAGLRAWLQLRPASENWWFNTIGQQMSLMPILVLLDGELPAELRDALLNLFTDLATVPADRRTGQNLVWYATQGIVRGALARNGSPIQTARDQLQSMLRFTTDEGIQADYSFHQHGPQLYSGGYGLGFLGDVTRAIGWLAETQWAFAPSAITLLADYALQGLMPLIRRDWLDWGARGREISRTEAIPRPAHVRVALQDLASHANERRSELDAAARQIEQGKVTPTAYSRAYWRSDFVAHQTPRGYFSIKLVSKRTVGTECGSDENLLGYWLPFGVTWIVASGNEYLGLQPLFDWSALPGLTAPSTVPAFRGYLRQQEERVAVLSDGQASVATMLLNVQQTQVKRMWFVFGDTLVALGSELRCALPQPVRTTLNQTRWAGSAQTDLGDIEAHGESSAGKGISWLWHGGVAYALLDGTKASFGVESRSRPGKDPSNLPYGASGTKGTVLSVWIDHGVRPAQGRYAYAVTHGVSSASTAKSLPRPRVLSNTGDIQAVASPDGDTLGVVFHRAGRLPIDSEQAIEASAPCVLLLRAAGNKWTLSANDIAGHGGRCTLTTVLRSAVIDSRTLDCIPILNRTAATPHAQAVLRRA